MRGLRIRGAFADAEKLFSTFLQGIVLIYGARHLCRFNTVCNLSVEAG